MLAIASRVFVVSWPYVALLAPVITAAARTITKAKEKPKAPGSQNVAKEQKEQKEALGDQFNLDKLLENNQVFSKSDNELLASLIASITAARDFAGVYVTRWGPIFRALDRLFVKFGDEQDLRCKVAGVLLAPFIAVSPSLALPEVTRLQQMCTDIEALDLALIKAKGQANVLGTSIVTNYSEVVAAQWQATNGAIAIAAGAIFAAAGCYFEAPSITDAGASVSIRGACQTLEETAGLIQLRSRLQGIQMRIGTITLGMDNQRKSVREHREDVTDTAMSLSQLEGNVMASKVASDALVNVLPRMFDHKSVKDACTTFEALEKAFS